MSGNAPGKDTLDLTIVIPCLNEERNIGGTLHSVAAAIARLPYSCEILVVDDGSSDATSPAVERYMAANPAVPVQLRRNAANRGLTRCYVDTAFLGRGRYYRLVCGDDVEPPETLAAVLRHLGEADIVIPWHTDISGKPAIRRTLSSLYTWLVNLLSGYDIRYYNGLALHLRYNVMRWGPYSFGFGFQAELITRLLDEGATFIQIPVAAIHREKEGKNSALNVRNFLSVCHTLLEIAIRRIRRHAF